MSRVPLRWMHMKRLQLMRAHTHTHTSQRTMCAHCRQKAGPTPKRRLHSLWKWSAGTRMDRGLWQSQNAAAVGWAHSYQIASVHNSSWPWSPLTSHECDAFLLEMTAEQQWDHLACILTCTWYKHSWWLEAPFSNGQRVACSDHCRILDVPRVVFFLFLLLGTCAE